MCTEKFGDRNREDKALSANNGSEETTEVEQTAVQQPENETKDSQAKEHAPASIQISTPEQHIEVINVYLTEWCHRGEQLWNQVSMFFYAAIIVIFTPYLQILSLDGDYMLALKIACGVAGIALGVSILFVGGQYGKRVKFIGKQYRKLLEMLPKEYHKDYFEEHPMWGDNQHFAQVLPSMMGIIVIVLAVGTLFFTLLPYIKIWSQYYE